MRRWGTRLRSWWKTLSGARRLNTEMDDEMQFHLDCYRRDLIARGLSETEATAQAQREFGSAQFHKEDCREALGLRLLGELWADLRYGLRMMRHDRALTVAAVASLALGIGANTAMFSVAKTVIFDSLRVKHPEELRLLGWDFPGREQPVPFLWGNAPGSTNGNFTAASFSYIGYKRIAEKRDVIDGLAALNLAHRLPVSVGSASAEMAFTQLVSGNYFDVLGVSAARGRTLRSSDEIVGAPAVTVISDQFWSKRFGRSPSALGSILRVSGKPVTIVGIAAENFRGTHMDETPSLFMPLTLQPQVDASFDGSQLDNMGTWWLQLLVRTKPSVSDARLRAELNPILKIIARETLPQLKPDKAQRFDLLILPGSRGEDLLQRRLARPTYILWALSALVLLLACTNVANLLLARGVTRQRELAIRLALGASRGRLIRQMLAEGGLLAGTAAAIGLAAAYLLHSLMPAFLSGQLPTTFDWQVCTFTLTIALATTLFFGLAPAAQNPAGVSNLASTSRMTASRRKLNLRRALVAAQVAFAALLLVAGGLFSRTLFGLLEANLGVDTEHLLLVNTNFSENRFPGEKRVEAQRRLGEQLSHLPGVRAAAVGRDAIGSGNDFTHQLQRRPEGRKWSVRENTVDLGFFEAAGIPLLRGRAFTKQDTATSPRVVVINERLARLVFPGEDPIGQKFSGGTEVIGICADSRLGDLRDDAPVALYDPFTQVKFWGDEVFYVRTTGSPENATAAVRKVFRDFDRDLPIMSIRSQRQVVADSLTQERLFAVLAGAFAVLSLLLGCVGVYGVTQFSVVRRTAEIGIRMALGAQRHTVVAAVLREGLVLVAVGLALGIGATMAASRFIAAMLYGVQPTDALTMGAAGATLLIAALLALWQPAWRAANISPLDALRHE